MNKLTFGTTLHATIIGWEKHLKFDECDES